MIFLTVGTQLPFDRLVRSVDDWAATHPDMTVVAQIGAVGTEGYHPKHMESRASMPSAEYDQMCRDARLIIAHAGTGSFIKAQTVGTPILAMPRKGALGEHRNDHQMATAAHFKNRSGIHIVHEDTEMAAAIDTLLAQKPERVELSLFAEESLTTKIRSVVFAKG
ncbi:glycosyltransferase [Celeribacter neptunius]|uniref:Glycosyltransferase family 28 C-terminal domain-containing protein n=1 Tax=Celeribacter neptunius TaxID=588602 RepID=A0A1I3SF55_9RHOB|nr:glycosyltransferase [Celeribacter neptunius]SFJ56201.1 Glycosyltransferase family 28 C-terminal domain-containing protein [Celeribacter neptunius]